MIAAGESPENEDDPFPPVVYIIQQEKKKWIKLCHMNQEHRGTIKHIQLVAEKELVLIVIERFKPKLPVIYLWSYPKEKMIACSCI